MKIMPSAISIIEIFGEIISDKPLAKWLWKILRNSLFKMSFKCFAGYAGDYLLNRDYETGLYPTTKVKTP